MRISDWSSDVCSSDLELAFDLAVGDEARLALLLVAEAEAGIPAGDILGQADVVDVGGLVVDRDALAGRRIVTVRPQPRVVGEYAGFGQPDERKRRGQVELDTMRPATADGAIGTHRDGDVFRVHHELADRPAGIDT